MTTARVVETSVTVNNNIPWVPEVFLVYCGNFRCWPKADTSSPRAAKSREKTYRAGHYKDLTETGNCARKVSGTQGNNNSPIQDYVHQDDQTQSTFDMYCYSWSLIIWNDALYSWSNICSFRVTRQGKSTSGLSKVTWELYSRTWPLQLSMNPFSKFW